MMFVYLFNWLAWILIVNVVGIYLLPDFSAEKNTAFFIRLSILVVSALLALGAPIL